MLRRMLRGSPRRRARSRLARFYNRHCLAPLIGILLVVFLEVYLHSRQYAVVRPEEDRDGPFYTSCQEPAVDRPRENAALVMLARNHELGAALKTVQSVERHFNRWFHYPVVFLNDEPWSQEFIDAMNGTVSGEVRFEVIPTKQWTFPAWLDKHAAQQSIAKQGKDGIIYAGLETYHHMCRFFSGRFFTLDALKQYRWYWRIEPGVDFYCSITYDPFVEMARHNKVYGFTIALQEGSATCPRLFREISDYKDRHAINTTELWKAQIVSSWIPWPFRSLLSSLPHRNVLGDSWSLCHYWSNFEIADMAFFRGQPYQQLFEYLERTGGFYFERWGDAPVHSLALALLADPARVHHFEDFGYRHDPLFQCPANAPGGQLPGSSALGNSSWFPEREGGIGCRCECDGSKPRNWDSYCINKIKQPNTARKGHLTQMGL